MWKKTRDFHAPKDINTKIWRYMDFTKLLSLFEIRALFFARLDTLAPSEGSLPLFNAIANILDLKIALGEDISKWKSTRTIGELKKLVQCDDNPDVLKELRKDIFVNCWHINEHESAAMWMYVFK